jgi:hypothetical protein
MPPPPRQREKVRCRRSRPPTPPPRVSTGRKLYDAIVKSGVTWARVKHLGWTKLNAIAGVLDGENADHWIGMASNHGRAEIKKLVQEHLAGYAVDAAIDAAKTARGLPDDSSALVSSCVIYMRLRWRKDGLDQAPDGLASVLPNFSIGSIRMLRAKL